jgi:hypothetical protein
MFFINDYFYCCHTFGLKKNEYWVKVKLTYMKQKQKTRIFE